MPVELKLDRDRVAKKHVPIFDCLKKTQTAFKFEAGKDIAKGVKLAGFVQRHKDWGAHQ